MGLDQKVLSQIQEFLAADASERRKLNAMLRLLAKWRAQLLQSTVTQTCGLAVQGGPFAGMQFLPRSMEGCHLPKLLGCYEAELHPHLLDAVGRGYRAVVNIGAAEGYYAVGLARLMPNARVYAYDTNAAAHDPLRSLAERNGVGDRISIHGLFRGEDFAAFADRRTLVVCDIEGAERELLDPERYPALRGVDLIVELHDVFDSKTSHAILERFASSHTIQTVPHGGRDAALPPLFQRLPHLDHLLAVWEWREGPTPWAVMLSRQPAGVERETPVERR